MFDLVYPKNEKRRLRAVVLYEEIAEEAAENLDQLASLAGRLLGTPAAFIAFMREEEQVVQASMGIAQMVVERRLTFCNSVIASGEPLLISDASQDPRYYDHPSVVGEEHLRFYFGVPLVAESGETIGTFCVTDREPRTLEPEQQETLELLAAQTMSQLELRRKERELTEEVKRAREAEGRFRRLLDASPDAIVLLRDAEIVAYNGSAVELFPPMGENGAVGADLFDLLERAGTLDHRRELLLRARADRARRRGITKFDWSRRNESGEVRAVEVTLSTVELDHREHFLMLVHDITVQKENETFLKQQRLRAETANRIKDTFLSMISHDLKSPLSSIHSMLELLEEEDLGGSMLPVDRETIYRDLKSSVGVLLEMTTQLLNLHRLQSGRIEINPIPVQPYQLVNQVGVSLDQRMREKEITLHNLYPAEAFVEADVALFREVIFNLLSNAVKFCSSGDTITVRRGEEGRVLVEDTGVGISDALLPDIFDKEVKTSRIGTDGEPGTGLGLPLCRDIMEAHSGDIEVSSRPGEGSRFALYFPPVTLEASGVELGEADGLGLRE